MQWWPPQRATRPAAVTGTAAAWVGWAAWVVWAAWECKDRAYDKTEDLQSCSVFRFFGERRHCALTRCCAPPSTKGGGNKFMMAVKEWQFTKTLTLLLELQTRLCGCWRSVEFEPAVSRS